MAIDPEPLTTLIALNRFGLGARPGDFARAASDPRGFLAQELQIPDITVIREDLPTSQEALQQVFALRERKRAERARKSTTPGGDAAQSPPPSAGAPAAVPATVQTQKPVVPPATPKQAPAPPKAEGQKQIVADPVPAQRLYRDEFVARIRKQMTVEAGFVERLVAFWSNHFAVSTAKGLPVLATAGAFERETIRPHVLGRFSDMLSAVEQHPTMLLYLDNQRSMGPNSKAGINRGSGLNENLAREILELHTLGVEGGYGQADVASLALIITGWSFAVKESGVREPGQFLFRKNWHEPGTHTLLGKRYAEDGILQGQTALADLARHPATAKHVVTKLVRHFVADTPPAPLIERLTKVFLDTEGDLAALSLALIRDDDSWRAPMTKIRSPVEFITAIARAGNDVPQKPEQLGGPLRAMGMVPWRPPGPNGFPDTVDAWASPEGMKARLEVSWRAAQQMKGIEQPLAVLEAVAGNAASRETHEAMSRAGSRQQALAILFMSPEFQRR
jgi:uncharacterized protein (DUF1800 family)